MSTSLSVQPSTANRTTIEFPHIHKLFEDMERLTRRISDKAFSLFQERGATDGKDWDDWFKAESELLRSVPIEVTESPKSYTIRAEVPGFKASELSVQLDTNSLYIHGKTEDKKETTEKGTVTYSEVSASEIARRVALPLSIDAGKSTAALKDGVLELTLPKMATSKSIEIKVA